MFFKKYVCNICGGTDFRDFRKREKTLCAGCNSVERSRILQLILDHDKLIQPGMRVLHLAPEAGIGRRIRSIIGSGYEAVDFKPEIYPADLEARKFDLTQDVEDLPSSTYDLVIHSHVMEHIPCDVTSVLWHLHRSIKPTGLHIFCLPLLSGRYESDFNAVTSDERTRRFGQFDHVRRFGRDDLDMHIGKVFRLNPYDASKILTEDISNRHRIPMGVTVGINSNTFFIQDKSSLKLQ